MRAHRLGRAEYAIRLAFAVALGAAGAAVLATSAEAKTWRVPADAPTVQAGLDSAQTGDEVLLDPGTYSWTSEGAVAFSMLFLSKPGITLRGEAGAAATILDAENDGRILRCHDVGDLVIEGITFRNGSATLDTPDRHRGHRDPRQVRRRHLCDRGEPARHSELRVLRQCGSGRRRRLRRGDPLRCGNDRELRVHREPSRKHRGRQWIRGSNSLRCRDDPTLLFRAKHHDGTHVSRRWRGPVLGRIDHRLPVRGQRHQCVHRSRGRCRSRGRRRHDRAVHVQTERRLGKRPGLQQRSPVHLARDGLAVLVRRERGSSSHFSRRPRRSLVRIERHLRVCVHRQPRTVRCRMVQAMVAQSPRAAKQRRPSFATAR